MPALRRSAAARHRRQHRRWRHALFGLTSRGVAGLVVSALLLVSGRVLAIFELTALGTALAAVIAVSGVLVWTTGGTALRLSRSRPDGPVHAGETIRITLHVANAGRRRSPTVLVRDHVEAGGRRVATRVAPMRAGDTRAAGYRLPLGARGRIALGPLEAVRMDPFGFFERWVGFGPDDAIVVRPAFVPLPPRRGRGQGSAPVWTAAARPADDDDRTALRDYQPGDDLRRVHWPSSARRGMLLVREAEATVDRGLRVVLDTVPTAYPDGSFELAVSIATSVAVSGAAARQPLSFWTTGPAPAAARVGPPGRPVAADTDRDHVLDRLAEIQPADGPGPRPDGPRGALTVLVTGPNGQPLVPAGDADALVLVAAPGPIAPAHGHDHPGHPGGSLPARGGNGHAVVITSLEDLAVRWSGLLTDGGGR